MDVTKSYDHCLEIRRELVLFPKIFRQFSEFAPTKYSGDFGIQTEIRPKFGNSSRRICDQILKNTRLQVTISLHIRNWVLVSYGGFVGQLRGASGGARSRRGLALAEGVYSPPLLPSSYARMAQLVERLLARKVAGSIPPTRYFEKM